MLGRRLLGAARRSLSARTSPSPTAARLRWQRPAGAALVSGIGAACCTCAAQTEEVLAKIDERLASCGTDKSKLISATIYLTDIKLKPAMNEAWKAWLGDLNRPTRTCIGGVELEPGVLVEITSTAAK